LYIALRHVHVYSSPQISISTAALCSYDYNYLLQFKVKRDCFRHSCVKTDVNDNYLYLFIKSTQRAGGQDSEKIVVLFPEGTTDFYPIRKRL